VPLATAPDLWHTKHVVVIAGKTLAVKSCGGVAHVDAATVAGAGVDVVLPVSPPPQPESAATTASSGIAMRALNLSVIVLSQRDLQGLPEANCACVRAKNNSWVRMICHYPLVLGGASKPA
jgi:hypothetical protein